jgi:hypothetical protein
VPLSLGSARVAPPCPGTRRRRVAPNWATSRSSTGETMTESTPHRNLSGRLLRGSGDALAIWDRVVVVCYLVLVLVGFTSSSVGVPGLVDDPAHKAPGLLIGSADPIRSDEYLRTTPWWIGVLESGGDDFGTPLGYHDVSLVTVKLGGPVTTAIFPDVRLSAEFGHLAPAQFFAAGWWLSILMVLLLLPRWFRRFGVGPEVSLPLTVVVLASPVTIWWSWTPVGVLSWALLAAVASSWAIGEGRARGLPSWRGCILLVVAGLSLTRLALSYQPWAVPLGASVLLPTTAMLLRPAYRRWRMVGLIVLPAVVGVATLGLFLAEHGGAASTIAGTAYPGARRFVGALSDPAVILGAPHLWVLQRTPELLATNLSEISSGFTVLGCLALLLVPNVRWRQIPSELRVATATSCIALASLASWCLVAWPNRADVLFPMNLVSPDRLAQVLGLAATLTFGLVFVAWRDTGDRSRLSMALVVAVGAFFLTAIGGSSFRATHLPSYRTVLLIFVSMIVAAALAAAILWARSWWSLLPLAVLACCVTATVNPWQQGFGDLRSGRSAQVVRAVERNLPASDRWASDDLFTDALLMANAVPSVSGQQWVGPNEAMWRRLDPDQGDRTTWNRAATYVTFRWGAPGSATTIALPGTDVVAVTTDPCGPDAAALRIRIVISIAPLARSCLSTAGTIELGGQVRHLYRRQVVS